MSNRKVKMRKITRSQQRMILMMKEDVYADDVQPEDTFMVDLSEILLRIHGEVHGEDGYVELQDEIPAGQEFEL